ncbi:MAG: signal peptide peptidase SppA [bacterium]|nr:signal peptide peptidase SppA [bacterium]
MIYSPFPSLTHILIVLLNTQKTTKRPSVILKTMFDKNTYDKLKTFWAYLKPFLVSFFHGLFWPFTWLESKIASIGLLISMIVLIAFGTFGGIVLITYIFSPDSFSSDTVSNVASSDTDTGNDDANCNTIGIEIRGCIMTYRPDSADSLLGSGEDSCDTITSSEDVVSKLKNATGDPNIKAVILEIDSGGGSPVGAEEIAAALKALDKPSIAWVRGGASSAAYWVASAADTIIASANSDIGSIGVTISYVDNAKQNVKDGLTYNQLTTGKYKDTGSPDRALTADERSLIQRDLDIMLKNFIQAVATNRNLSVANVTALADGSTMLGRMALRNGLIDQLGTQEEVWEKLGSEINQKPDVCWP